MKRSIVILPLARSDLYEIGLYLSERNLAVSKRFNRAAIVRVRKQKAEWSIAKSPISPL